MAANWTQHPAAPQGYPYPSYPQQQGQQQYGPQQYGPPQPSHQFTPHHDPSQPYGYSQPGQYPQPYQQPPVHPQVAQPTPSTCYNCGSPDHWAQNCPEPRREVPAGEANRQSNPRPPKRQKSNAPVITRYPVPGQTYRPPHTYGGATNGQPNYQQHQPPYGPPTPMSAQGSPPHQWQHLYSQPQYQPPYQQGAQYPHQPYPSSTSPGSGSSYVSHYPSPVSAQGPQPYQGFYAPQDQYRQQQNPHSYSFSSASPTIMESPQAASPAQQFHKRVSTDDPHLHNGPTGFISPMPQLSDSQATSQPIADQTEGTDEDDDLGCLDIPDIPCEDGKPMRLVGFPLPSNFVVADTLSPLPSPTFEDEGRIRSKYFASRDPGILCQHLKHSSEWNAVKEDPVFQILLDNEEVVPIKDLIASHMQHLVPEPSSDVEREDGEVTQEGPGAEANTVMEDGEAWNLMDSLENALNKRKASETEKYSGFHDLPPKPTPLEDQNRSSTSGLNRDTEDILASLGVTGAPKPVRAPARPYPPPETHDRLQEAASDQEGSSRSRSPGRAHSITLRNERVSSSSEQQNENMGSSRVQRASDSNGADAYEQQIENGVQGTYHGQSSSIERPYPQAPPPPTPPKRKFSSYDGINESPISPGSFSGDRNGHHGQNPDHENGYHRSLAGSKSTPLIKLRTERVITRKREYDARDSSDDERENERRRQADDVTPKLKRRQPKVAEAYSRRW